MNTTIKHRDKEVTFYDVDERDGVESELIRGHWYELETLEFIRSLNIEGDYVDIGAYIGTFSIYCSLFTPMVHVTAFEPQLRVYRKLLQNLKENQIYCCTPLNFGLSDHWGRGKAEGDPYNMGGAKLREGDEVPVLTLDSLHIYDVSLVKIDVEGMEYQVIQGGSETIRHARHLIVESWDQNRPKVEELINSLGFNLEKDLGWSTYYYHRRE